MTFAGHPDWTPAVRGYAAGLVQARTTETVTAGTTFGNHNLAADTLYDVNVVQVLLPTLCMVMLGYTDDTGNQILGQSVLNPYATAQVVHIPARNLGNIIQVWFFNLDTVAHDFTWAVRGYNGVPSEELRQPPVSASAVGPGLAPGVFTLGPEIGGLGLYDQLAWTAFGSGPFDVVARSWFPQGPVAATGDMVLGSSVAGEGITGAMPIGAIGLALGAVVTGPAPATVEMTARAWHGPL